MNSLIRYFDPETPARKRRQKAVFFAFGLFILGIVLGGFLGIAFGAKILLGLLGACGGYALAKTPDPTVTCAACNARGWVADIRASNGTCPRCGQDRFLVRGRRRTTGQRITPSRETVVGFDLVSCEVVVEGDSGDGGTGGDGGDGGDGGGD